MKKLATLILSVLLLSILSPILESFHIQKSYSYKSEESVQALHFTDVPDQTAGLGIAKATATWKKAQGISSFSSGKNMFTFAIPMTSPLEGNESNVRITLDIDGKKIPVSIDEDGDGRSNGYYYTEPVFLDPLKTLSYTVETRSNIAIPAISVIGLDTEESTSHIAFGISKTSADDSINIVKRADWGADETLRYKDSPTWVKVFAKLAADKDKPKSDATLKYEARVNNIRAHLAVDFPEQDNPIETIRTENGHDLVWPIEKTKKVERIVVHHTAENNQTNKDDLALIRGIYYYHTVVRGWGDIGYNYLVGQRGQIYEGRA